VEHVQPFGRSFPWRAAALSACAVALLALAGLRLLAIHHGAASTRAGTTPAGVAARKPVVVPLRARSRLSVLVLNGNGIAHAAGEEATQLLSRGYRSAYPTDAPSTYGRSLVLFRPGREGEAKRLARDAGIRTVSPLDGRLPRTDARYQLVLILGAN
jgi:LytR cell envelope-related transcriptional attenuator